jgi:hypothetical protein
VHCIHSVCSGARVACMEEQWRVWSATTETEVSEVRAADAGHSQFMAQIHIRSIQPKPTRPALSVQDSGMS